MKRSRETIIKEILNTCTGGATKTRIVYQANLNFRTVNPYLELLMSNDLIAVRRDPHIVYETTEKGLKLMQSLNSIQTALS
ncbi:MAG: winged helix-turn-helix domain-containing protein [Methanothrix sp.]|nr:winged helix-turn-helix domain-containing protein [Methanothrix sp.]